MPIVLALSENPAVLQCQEDGVRPVVGIKLLQDGADVVLYGLLAYTQKPGNALIGVALRDMGQDLDLFRAHSVRHWPPYAQINKALVDS